MSSRMNHTAIEDRIHADLEQGRHSAVLAELDALVAAHPLRERLHAQRMLALHRCGRRADALAAYRDAERHLDPSADLQSLQRAILADDPALAAPAPAPGDTEAVTVVPSTPEPVAPAPPQATRPSRRRPALAAVTALVLAGGAAGGLAMHSLRASASPQDATAAATDAFPNQQELRVIDRFGAAVTDCHRYPLHYAKALADVECHVRPDHPGATSLLLQSFAAYGDLEMHFHHVLALTIQDQTGRPVTAAYHGDCADSGSGFFALANHRPADSGTANGHVICYADHAGVPHLAWTDVSRMTVAQAVGGPGAPADAQAALLGFWRGLYPNETVYPQPDTTAVTTAAVSSAPSPAAAEQVAQTTPAPAAAQAAAPSQPQLAPTPSPTPAPIAPARTATPTSAATPAPSPSPDHGDSWRNGWDAFWHHGHN